jgi:CubicO group peptidase (beta-lactamase class C family)
VGLKTFSGDLLWFASELSRGEVIRVAKTLEPVRGFRSGYGYQNIMYMVAGEFVASVSGMPWEEYIQKEFLTPLGMNRTLTSIDQLSGVNDVSAPHNDVKGENLPIEWSNWDNMGPAGSLISSANDMSRWLLLQLGEGSLDEKQYFSEKSQHEMWTIHTPKKLSGFHRSNFPSKHFSGYGLGWDLFDYHGRMVVNHGGGYDGFISQSCLVPEEELGFIILTNNNSYFAWSMMYQILDIYLNPDGVGDFPSKMLEYKRADEKEKQEKEKAINEARHKKTSPSLDMEAYLGDYVDEKYGKVSISKKGDELYLRMEPTPLFHGKLEHWHYDTFRLVWSEQHMLPDGMVTFQLDKNGLVDKMDISCPNPDLYFYELDLKKQEENPD